MDFTSLLSPSGKFTLVKVRPRHRHHSSRESQPAEEPLVASEAILADASSYLDRLDARDLSKPMNRHERADWIKSSLIRINKQNRKQQIECIARVYATYVLQQHDPALNLVIIQTAQTLAPGRTQTTILRLLLELSISYSGSSSPSEIKLEQNSYSRDASAIMNLMRRGVLPSKVLELSRKPGEGLNAWARWKPDNITVPEDLLANVAVEEPEGSTKSASPSATGVEKAGARKNDANLTMSPPAVIGHELVWEKILADGSVVPIKRTRLNAGEMDQFLFELVSDLITSDPSDRFGRDIDEARLERAKAKKQEEKRMRRAKTSAASKVKLD